MKKTNANMPLNVCLVDVEVQMFVALFPSMMAIITLILPLSRHTQLENAAGTKRRLARHLPGARWKASL